MKKWIVIFIILGLLFLTNPTKDEYVSWMKDKSTANSGQIEKGLVSVFGNFIYGGTTTSTNLYLFSIFETKLDTDKPYRVIGIFKNFIPINF
ncbi:hypothetical protein E0485_20205 [Paenibacillus albiflavus]|uniref:DUF4359 domain-containing protein n=1 Tax=Paenibacillus albiflavus TaxID=2545760 RepID=A0A4R4E5Z4_9BACL|nr:hypothetical protein [Paenibacillus albiflavus]TCZ74303.1 hypothetical protein E0485_20205 [Paenibacillus albiflavus]